MTVIPAEAARVGLELRTRELIGAILARFPNATIAGVRARSPAGRAPDPSVPVTLQELWGYVLSEQTTHQVAAAMFPDPDNARRAMCADAVVRLVGGAMDSPVIMGELARLARLRKAAAAKAEPPAEPPAPAAAEAMVAPAEDQEGEDA